MTRKWEWIREYCKRQGFEESAEIADQIDRVLCYLYPDFGVEVESYEPLLRHCRSIQRYVSMVEGFRMGKEEVLRRVVFTKSLCAGCVESGGCFSCRFGELTGLCVGITFEGQARGFSGCLSLFRSFYDMYVEEAALLGG